MRVVVVLRKLLVSLVDGYNLPIAITNNVNCEVAGCAVDLGPNCACLVHQVQALSSSEAQIFTCCAGPSELAGPTNTSGVVVGCKSACLANLDGDSSKFLGTIRQGNVY